jgi:hypothetical protein
MNDKKLTITEALAEIKTIGKRIETKQSQLESYIVRDSRMRDPMEKDGGSVEYIKRERQAINDLQKRVIELRLAIQKSNMVTSLALNGREMTVYEWLIWRREVAPTTTNQLSRIWQTLQTARRGAQQRGMSLAAAVGVQVQSGNETQEIIVNVNEQEIAKERESVEAVLGELDGRLSLINATTLI